MSGPHSIPVSWEPVPVGFVHGILLGYRIFYTVKRIAGEDVRKPTLNTTTNETALRTTLSDLLNYALYEIKIAAFTVKGDGAISLRITAGLFNCFNHVEGISIVFGKSSFKGLMENLRAMMLLDNITCLVTVNTIDF